MLPVRADASWCELAGRGHHMQQPILRWPALARFCRPISKLTILGLQVGTTLQLSELQHTMGADFTTWSKAHTWTIDWQPTYLRIFVNGVPLQEFIPSASFKVRSCLTLAGVQSGWHYQRACITVPAHHTRHLRPDR